MGHMSPGFEFQNTGEILWCHIRGRLQQILQFDEEWIVDTPRSETLWAETCQQNDITRAAAACHKTARAASGPIGFTWWGWLLPQRVDLVPTPRDGVWRLRACVELGQIAQGERDRVISLAHGFQSFAVGGVLVLGDDDILRMVFSIALDGSMAEEVSQFAAGLLHRQVAYAGYIAGTLGGVGLLSVTPEHHPAEGPREVPDEFIQILFENAQVAVPPAHSENHPSCPEGMDLARAFVKDLPALVEREMGWRYRPGIGEPEEAVFSNDPTEDPYTYFAFLPVEHTNLEPALTGEKSPFRNDPHLRIRLQIATAESTHYPSRLLALHAANERLWSTWRNASANIVGCFTPGESSAGFYVGPTWVLWPAASLPGPQGVDVWARTIAHLWAHVGDQAMYPRPSGSTSTAPTADRRGEMREMLNHLRGLDKKSKEFAALRNDLSALLQAHPNPGEVAEIRSELARLLW
jgi:hypothetical protein